MGRGGKWAAGEGQDLCWSPSRAATHLGDPVLYKSLKLGGWGTVSKTEKGLLLQSTPVTLLIMDLCSDHLGNRTDIKHGY